MKKKLSVLAVLVLAVAISAYSVAGTYAKYTTTGEVTDNARVAKWGFKIGKVNETQADLFSDAYINTATEYGTDSPRNTVEASDEGTKVIAPGTTGSYTFKVNGRPEVAYSIAIDADVVITNDIDLDENHKDLLKNNLKFTLKKNGSVFTYKVNPTDTDEVSVENVTAATLKTALNKLYNSGTRVNANVETDDKYEISWSWAFTDTTDAAATALQDAIDTALGNAAATNSKPSVRLTAKITATQVD